MQYKLRTAAAACKAYYYSLIVDIVVAMNVVNTAY